MRNRRTAFWAGGMGLMMSCILVGCTKEVRHDNEDLVLSSNEVTVTQGYSAAPTVILSGQKSGMDKIEGGKDGVTASFQNPGFLIFVNAARDAKVGQVELIIKNKAGKTASLKVTVQEPVNKLDSVP